MPAGVFLNLPAGGCLNLPAAGRLWFLGFVDDKMREFVGVRAGKRTGSGKYNRGRTSGDIKMKTFRERISLAVPDALR